VYNRGVPDSPLPDAPDDFDDATELVKGWSVAAKAKAGAPAPADFGDDEEDSAGGWDEEEATAVVGATDIGGFFGERFRVDARLGIGAMGRVLTAVDMKTGTLVALKVLHKDRAKDAAVVERFQREAAVLREIRHPAIVRLVAFDRSRDGTWWLAMEHLVGKTLKDRLAQGGAFTPRDAWPVLATVCDGVATAHAQGILHRDLKPENVLLLESGLPPCKILDFGLSRYTAKPDRITATGTVLGTPRYMAPEVLMETGTVDERVDVFALGAIAFEMLTGRSIYPADDFGQLFGCILEGRVLSLRSIRPDAPPALERVLADAVAKDLSARIPTVDMFARRFAQAIGVSEDRSVFVPGAAAASAEPGSGIRDTSRDLKPLRGLKPSVPRPGADPSPASGEPASAAPGPAPARQPAPMPVHASSRALPPAPIAPPPRPAAIAAPAPQQAPAAPRTSHAAAPPHHVPAAPYQSLPAAPPQHAAAPHQSLPPPQHTASVAPRTPDHSPARAFAPPPGRGSGAGAGNSGGPGPAGFTRPNGRSHVEPPPSGGASRLRSIVLWAVLFVVAAVFTMAAAGTLAYAVRLWLTSH